MNKTQMNLQDLFLNQVRKENTPVTIYLTGGVQLKGMVKGFDAFTVILESQGKTPQLIYKHAIASVVPLKPIGMREMTEERIRVARGASESVVLPADKVEPEDDEKEQEE